MSLFKGKLKRSFAGTTQSGSGKAGLIDLSTDVIPPPKKNICLIIWRLGVFVIGRLLNVLTRLLSVFSFRRDYQEAIDRLMTFEFPLRFRAVFRGRSDAKWKLLKRRYEQKRLIFLIRAVIPTPFVG